MPGHAGSSFGRSIFLFRYCSLRSLFSLVHLSLFVFSFITLCFHQLSKHTTVNKVFYNLRRIRTKSFHWQAMMKFLAIHQFELLTWLSFPNLLLVVIQNIKKLFLLHILALDVHWTRLRLLVRAGAVPRDSYFTPIMITGLSGMGM